MKDLWVSKDGLMGEMKMEEGDDMDEAKKKATESLKAALVDLDPAALRAAKRITRHVEMLTGFAVSIRDLARIIQEEYGKKETEDEG